jgi:hypothetical protein
MCERCGINIYFEKLSESGFSGLGDLLDCGGFESWECF